jgi:serine/threonine protein kinase
MPTGTSRNSGGREESLGSRLAQGPLPLPFALRCATDVAAALRELHRAGLAHGEVSPASVVLRPSGAALLPPNGLVGEANSRADVAAFGAVLYEMLTGGKPPSGGHLAAPAERVPEAGLPGLRAAATRLAAKCLATAPDEVPSTQMILIEVRLMNVLAQQLGAKSPAPPQPPPPPAPPQLAPPRPAPIPETRRKSDPVASGTAAKRVAEPPRTSPVGKCPKCGSRQVHESRPRTRFELIVSDFGIPLRRCHRCHYRYLVVFRLVFSIMPLA